MKSELAWCMLSMMSDPPTNSPLINICGNVGQLLHIKNITSEIDSMSNFRSLKYHNTRNKQMLLTLFA
jgi:hypothetical protein